MGAAIPEAGHGIPAYRKLFIMGWIAYFINYLGRYNFAAAMVVIGEAEGFTSAQLGLVVSALFFSYGAGQICSGMLGDRLPPQHLITIGLLGSGAVNLAMGLTHSLGVMQGLWLLNGIFCSLIWAPMVRLLNGCMPPQRLRGALLTFQYSTALGTCFTYVFTSLMVDRFPWQAVFLAAGGLILAVTLAWQLAAVPVCRALPRTPAASPTPSRPAGRTGGFRALYVLSGLPLLLGVILVMGVLKDGILTWVPQMVTDTYGTGASLSIFLSAALPLVNLSGVEAVRWLARRGQDDVRISWYLFAGAALTMGALLLTSGTHPLVTVLLFSVVSSCVFGVNSVLISFIPLRYAAYGRTSTMAGVTNAFTYLGSALSGWGLGLTAQVWGWQAANGVLLGLCVLGFVLCWAARPLWRQFILQGD